jgi:hypothetical protein
MHAQQGIPLSWPVVWVSLTVLWCALCLQQLLEGAGVAYTGVTADYALNSCNRIALNKVSLPGNTWWR